MVAVLPGGTMQIIDIKQVLLNITGFSPGNPANIEQRHNADWHWFKHCFAFLADIHHVLTADEYLRIGREIATDAANARPDTYIKGPRQ
jgi:hypothetical protein